MDDYGVTEAELQEINDEFEEKERKGDEHGGKREVKRRIRKKMWEIERKII